MAKEAIPSGVKLTPLDERFKTDPYAVLASLGVGARTHRDTELNRGFFAGHKGDSLSVSLGAANQRGYEYHATPSFRGLSSFWVNGA